MAFALRDLNPADATSLCSTPYEPLGTWPPVLPSAAHQLLVVCIRDLWPSEWLTARDLSTCSTYGTGLDYFSNSLARSLQLNICRPTTRILTTEFNLTSVRNPMPCPGKPLIEASDIRHGLQNHRGLLLAAAWRSPHWFCLVAGPAMCSQRLSCF